MGKYTEKSNLLANQRFYEEMAPDDISRSFFIDKNGNAIGWRMIRANGTRLSYDAGNRGFFPFDVLPDDKAINLPPYDYIDGKIVSLGKEQSVTLERPESFYLGATKVLQTPDGFMCQLSAADNYVPFRTDIRDIKAGDIFASSSLRDYDYLHTAIRDSHQNLDEPDEPWIVYDGWENGWFEEDIMVDPYTSALFQLPEHYLRKEISSLTAELKDISEHRHEKSTPISIIAALDENISELKAKLSMAQYRLNKFECGPVHEAVLPISRKDVAFINKVLDMNAAEIYDAYGIKRDEKLSYSAAFNNGYKMDINVVFCDDSSPYVDLVLYDKDGHELASVVHEDYIDQEMVLSFSDWKGSSAPVETHTFYVHPNVIEQAQEQSVEKSSLSDQIRQAEARTTPINAEKETHNIEQDRR